MPGVSFSYLSVRALWLLVLSNKKHSKELKKTRERKKNLKRREKIMTPELNEAQKKFLIFLDDKIHTPGTVDFKQIISDESLPTYDEWAVFQNDYNALVKKTKELMQIINKLESKIDELEILISK